ncbi:ABC transporter ATP-binding protein [Bryobacter aggregatus]|uniref:ABC transporter ATP-binding protein n=1 Tax=Bryobacter aggregatus TaxID=360054 RepID=UPI0006894DA5|nr:ABC transporter ATP-binding protein [Bryobacter aggregatus]
MKSSIAVDRVAKTYRGASELTIFADMSFVVNPGERVALIGESGAGKSTLLHLLGGLDHPTTGAIHFGETDITKLTARELASFRNREMGFVWQVQSLLPEFTAIENVMMPLLVRGETPEQARPAAATMLEEVGLAARLEHRAGELSGGEQQRVVLARALVGKPKYLLADEPTGNLDERTAGQILDLLERLQEVHQLTSVIVTHSPALAARCDRTLRLAKGGLVEVAVTMEANSHV